MRRGIIFAVVLIQWACELEAQQTFHSLDELWKYVDAHNVQVSLSRTQQGIADAGVVQARNNFLPSVYLNGAFTDNLSIQPTLVPAELFGGQSGTFVEEQFGKQYNYNVGMNAQVDLINTSNWFLLKAARFDEAISELNWTLNRKNIYSAASQAYFTYCLMYESEKLSEESLRTAEVMQSHAVNLYALGQISQATLNATTIQVKSASIHLLASRQSQRNALNQLKQLLEMSVMDSLVLSENLPMELSVGIENAMQRFSDDISVRLSQAQMAAAKNTWQESCALYVPTLSAVYAYNTQITGDDFLSFGGANHLPQQYWGLRLTVPLLTNGMRTFRKQKAQLELAAATEGYESSLRQMALNDDNLISDYWVSREQLKTSEGIMELYHDNDEHAARQLEAGQISLDERLRVYQDYITYKNEYLHNLSDFYTRYAALKVRQQLF